VGESTDSLGQGAISNVEAEGRQRRTGPPDSTPAARNGTIAHGSSRHRSGRSRIVARREAGRPPTRLPTWDSGPGDLASNVGRPCGQSHRSISALRTAWRAVPRLASATAATARIRSCSRPHACSRWDCLSFDLADGFLRVRHRPAVHSPRGCRPRGRSRFEGRALAEAGQLNVVRPVERGAGREPPPSPANSSRLWRSRPASAQRPSSPDRWATRKTPRRSRAGAALLTEAPSLK